MLEQSEYDEPMDNHNEHKARSDQIQLGIPKMGLLKQNRETQNLVVEIAHLNPRSPRLSKMAGTINKHILVDICSIHTFLMLIVVMVKI